MPQTTLGKGLKISSSPPISPVKKKSTNMTPAKANGAQGLFGGKSSSMQQDLETLGLDKSFLDKHEFMPRKANEESAKQGTKIAPGEEREDADQDSDRPKKRQKNSYEIPHKVARASNAARVDENPPLDVLESLQERTWGYNAKSGPALVKNAGGAIKLEKAGKDGVEKGQAVLYWMRMEDMRSERKPFNSLIMF